jgi:glucose-1-phosphate cytidylyltransferase
MGGEDQSNRGVAMKVGILAGGFGTRLVEETERLPKPMVEIGGRPILWHIMRYYEHFGFTDFAVALGYKADYIKRWFVDYSSLEGDLHLDLTSRDVIAGDVEDRRPWTVSLIETGLETGTGGRIKRLLPHLGPGTCMVTWGDGLANIDLDALLAFHRSHGKLATLTAVRPPARFGHLEIEGDQIVRFDEKPQTGEGWINGAFFVLEPEVGEYIEGDKIMFELAPLQKLAADGQLMAYRHHGFWQAMDTLRDMKALQRMWETDPLWKVW